MADKRSYTLSDIPTIFTDELASFHIGGSGIAGSIDEQQRCLGAVYKEAGAEQAMVNLCRSPNKAVRLYGLLGLKLVNSEMFQQEYDKLANDQDDMFTWSGCMGGPSTVGRLANQIYRSDVQWLRDLHTPRTLPDPPRNPSPRPHGQNPASGFSNSDLPAELVHGMRGSEHDDRSVPDIVSGIPMFISPAQMGAAEAGRGHFDPYVADWVTKANRLIRAGIETQTNLDELKAILHRLLKYDEIGAINRWFIVRRLVSAIRQGIQDGHYTCLAAWPHPGYGPDARNYHCGLMVVALPDPYPVHGMPMFTPRPTTMQPKV